MTKLKNYRVIVGYVQLKNTENGEMINNGEKFPITPFNVIVDSPEVAEYLVREMQVFDKYNLQIQEKAPIYFEYELN